MVLVLMALLVIVGGRTHRYLASCHSNLNFCESSRFRSARRLSPADPWRFVFTSGLSGPYILVNLKLYLVQAFLHLIQQLGSAVVATYDLHLLPSSYPLRERAL